MIIAEIGLFTFKSRETLLYHFSRRCHQGGSIQLQMLSGSSGSSRDEEFRRYAATSEGKIRRSLARHWHRSRGESFGHKFHPSIFLI